MTRQTSPAALSILLGFDGFLLRPPSLQKWVSRFARMGICPVVLSRSPSGPFGWPPFGPVGMGFCPVVLSRSPSGPFGWSPFGPMGMGVCPVSHDLAGHQVRARARSMLRCAA